MIFTASVIAVLSLTTSAPSVSALSLNLPSLHQRHHAISLPTTALHLTPMDQQKDDSGDDVDSPRVRRDSDESIDSLISKRAALKKKAVANIKPDDMRPSRRELKDLSADSIQKFIEESGTSWSSVDEVKQWFESDGAMPELKTKRRTAEGEDGKEKKGGEYLFMDYESNYEDENEMHIPNRIGFSTCDWGDSSKGFVSGKLKKSDRKDGKFNKSDLKKAYEKLVNSGVNFIETSETYSFAEELLNTFIDEIPCDEDYQPMVSSTFSNPWKKAYKSKSLPRRGAKAIVDAAEESAKRLGVDSMALYQVQNPGLYIGGTKAIANGMLDIIGDDHARFVGCKDWSAQKLAKLVYLFKEIDGGEFVASNQFEFSITNRKNMQLLEACKKLGITPICRNVLDNGLATGKYTSLNPTGDKAPQREGDMGPFKMKKLESLDVLFKVMDKIAEDASKRVGGKLKTLALAGKRVPSINKDITAAQVAIKYVQAKGGVPIVPVNNLQDANTLLGVLGWDLDDKEVEKLDKACQQCGV